MRPARRPAARARAHRVRRLPPGVGPGQRRPLPAVGVHPGSRVGSAPVGVPRESWTGPRCPWQGHGPTRARARIPPRWEMAHPGPVLRPGGCPGWAGEAIEGTTFPGERERVRVRDGARVPERPRAPSWIESSWEDKDRVGSVPPTGLVALARGAGTKAGRGRGAPDSPSRGVAADPARQRRRDRATRAPAEPFAAIPKGARPRALGGSAAGSAPWGPARGRSSGQVRTWNLSCTGSGTCRTLVALGAALFDGRRVCAGAPPSTVGGPTAGPPATEPPRQHRRPGWGRGRQVRGWPAPSRRGTAGSGLPGRPNVADRARGVDAGDRFPISIRPFTPQDPPRRGPDPDPRRRPRGRAGGFVILAPPRGSVRWDPSSPGRPAGGTAAPLLLAGAGARPGLRAWGTGSRPTARPAQPWTRAEARRRSSPPPSVHALGLVPGPAHEVVDLVGDPHAPAPQLLLEQQLGVLAVVHDGRREEHEQAAALTVLRAVLE